MTLTQLKRAFRRYRTVVAGVALLFFSATILGVIYFMQQAEGPLAPTAPASRPQAAENVCSLQFEIQNTCLSLTASQTVEKGKEVFFRCEGSPGTDSYRFYYQTTEAGEYQVLSEGSSATSSAVLVGDYVAVACEPWYGDYGVQLANLPASCKLAYAAPVPTPTPTPTPTPPPQTGGFVIEKFEDADSDGQRDDAENGLDWTFEWRKVGETNWNEYIAYANQNGRGGNIGGRPVGEQIEIREKSKDGWEATTVTQRTITIQEQQYTLVRFGNKKKVTATPTPAPQCNAVCVTNSDCPSSMTCSSGRCRNPQCTGETDCACAVASTSTPTPVVTTQPKVSPTPAPALPTAGSVTQTYAMLFVGLGTLTLGIARYLAHKR